MIKAVSEYGLVCATYCFQVDQKLDLNCIDTIQVKLLIEYIVHKSHVVNGEK